MKRNSCGKALGAPGGDMGRQWISDEFGVTPHGNLATPTSTHDIHALLGREQTGITF
jgi:hypothetical protein